MAFGFLATRGYTPGNQFYQLPIGGGGYVTGCSISSDGTVACRNDSGLAFRLDTVTNQWISLVTLQSMPVGFQSIPLNSGVYEAVISFSDSNRLYMIENGYFFKTINGGASWTQMANFNGGVKLPGGSVPVNSGATRLFGRKIEIDPVNPDICVIGTGVNGVYITRDGGNSFTGPLPIPPSPPQTVFTTAVHYTLTLPLVSASGTTLTFTSTSIVVNGVTISVIDGQYVYDASNLLSIPANTTVISHTATTVTLSNPVNVSIANGDTIGFQTVVGSAYPGYSITFDPTSAAQIAQNTITAGSWAATGGGQVTFTTATPHGVSVGENFIISGISPSGYNGVFTAIAGTTGSTLVAALAVNPGVFTASGILEAMTLVIYIGGYHNPMYKSTDGGVTWNPLNSGTFPTTFRCSRVGPDQTLWVVSDASDHTSTNGNVWSCTPGGVWSNFNSAATGQGASPATNLTVCLTDTAPNIRLIVFTNAIINLGYTTNGFGTPGSNYAQDTIAVTDATWVNNHGSPSMGWAEFDPSRTDGFFWVSHGLGMYNAILPPSRTTPVIYNGVLSGIENLTPSQSLSSPGPGTTVVWLTVWDQGVFKVDPLGQLATIPNHLNPSTAICAGWGMDYASSDPTFMCACLLFGDPAQHGQAHSGFSTDHGFTWQEFPVQILGDGACIAAATPQDLVICPGVDASNVGGLPQVSNNQGTTWYNPVTLPQNGNGYVFGRTNKCDIVCADRTNIGTFYLYYFFQTSARVSAGSTTNQITFPNNTVTQTLLPGYIVTDLTTPANVPPNTTVVSVSGNIVTLNNNVNIPAPAPQGDNIQFTDPGNGVWISTNSGRSWLQQQVGGLSIGGTNGCRLLQIPGEPAGTLLICGSKFGSAGTVLMSTDFGQTWNNINTGISSVVDYGIGAAAPGSSHVTLFVIMTFNTTITASSWSSTNGGQVTFTTAAPHGLPVGVSFVISGETPAGYNGTYTTIAGTTGSTLVAALATNPGVSTKQGTLAVFGIYKSHDLGQSFIFISGGFPANNLPNMNNIGGDFGVYGRTYISCTGTAWFYSNYVSGP